ncbi:MAG TPA: helix-turn-helix domain-containing protein [Chloroflexota bacterium]|nr:helix-turn-helix domain-containing protein [Chloroflexota bacterium]
MREIMTPEQVADLLQINTETVYRLIRDRKLAASKIGRAYRVTRIDLEAFLASTSTMPTLREALFRRVLAIGERHLDRDSDALLAELEQLDEEARERVHAQRSS